MLNFSGQIFVYANFVDMRKSINGLCILATLSLQTFECGKAFVFFNSRLDKVKILTKENNGFVLLYKRLDKGKFKISFNSKTEILLSVQQLRYLLDGLDYERLIFIKTPSPKHYF